MDYSCILYESLVKIKTKSNLTNSFLWQKEIPKRINVPGFRANIYSDPGGVD